MHEANTQKCNVSSVKKLLQVSSTCKGGTYSLAAGKREDRQRDVEFAFCYIVYHLKARFTSRDKGLTWQANQQTRTTQTSANRIAIVVSPEQHQHAATRWCLESALSYVPKTLNAAKAGHFLAYWASSQLRAPCCVAHTSALLKAPGPAQQLEVYGLRTVTERLLREKGKDKAKWKRTSLKYTLRGWILSFPTKIDKNKSA